MSAGKTTEVVKLLAALVTAVNLRAPAVICISAPPSPVIASDEPPRSLSAVFPAFPGLLPACWPTTTATARVLM
jgi:hypothetical protein